MFSHSVYRVLMTMTLSGLILSGCFHPPFNNFVDDHRTLKRMAVGAGVGAGVGAVAGSVAGNTLVGALIGGAAGSALGLVGSSEQAIIEELARQDIQYVEHGDTRVLILPTDRFFVINSHRLHERCYQALNNIARLMKLHSCNPIYVAGFTDDIGTRYQKNKLSQSRADALVTFLWAKGVRAQRLHAEGYGDKFDVGDNHLIHGSAYNRRIEIQWIDKPMCAPN